MGTLKDSIDTGVEALQFWLRFKGKRVRVWPSDLTLDICTQSCTKWVRSPEGAPPTWWEVPPQARPIRPELMSRPESDIRYVAANLATSDLPNLESVETARLFDATIGDVTKNPAGLYLTDIEYWIVVGELDERRVMKVPSTDEGMLLPLSKLARIDFVKPGDPEPERSWP